MKIVSLNKPYSILRWLVRDEAQAQANAAQAYRCVTAQNVTFVKSPHHGEVGFGNGTVAKCASAEGKQTFIAIPAHCFRLLIDAEGNFRDEHSNVVQQCSRLYFLNNGNMFAVAAEVQADDLRGREAA